MKVLYDRLNRLIEGLLIVIFGLFVLDVLLQVFARYVLNQSYSFTEEFARFALIWLAVLGAAWGAPGRLVAPQGRFLTIFW